MSDDEVHIVDAYNPQIYPGDEFAKKGISTEIPVFHYDDDESYLEKLSERIPEAYQSFRPELVIYNAGTDCMIGDPLGQL
jgi:histone deacetylase 11